MANASLVRFTYDNTFSLNRRRQGKLSIRFSNTTHQANRRMDAHCVSIEILNIFWLLHVSSAEQSMHWQTCHTNLVFPRCIALPVSLSSLRHKKLIQQGEHFLSTAAAIQHQYISMCSVHTCIAWIIFFVSIDCRYIGTSRAARPRIENVETHVRNIFFSFRFVSFRFVSLFSSFVCLSSDKSARQKRTIELTIVHWICECAGRRQREKMEYYSVLLACTRATLQ